MDHFLITGGAGYIGSNLAKFLLKKGNKITIFDKLPIDTIPRLHPIKNEVNYIQLDIKNLKTLKQKMKNFDVIAHFAASTDIALGKQNTEVDFQEGIITTFNILEAMKDFEIKKIIFPSSSTIYGNFSKIPTPEDAGLLFPTSLYGAAKLSSEALISAYCHLFDMQSWIFRFGNVVGLDMTRGVIIDFVEKLTNNSQTLKILGDGKQRKDFIYIDDCLEGILFGFENSKDIINVFNLGTGETTEVNEIAKKTVSKMNLKEVKFSYTGGKSGWQGDAPLVHYDISKIKKLGWNPKYNSDKAVETAIDWTVKNWNFYESITKNSINN